MTSRSAHQMSSSDILVLITEFYCGLTVKKNMQNISCQIRQFVMINEKIKNKDQTAKKILDFFLKIQQKLVKRTEKQWDQVFQTSIARAQALLRICVFPNRHLLIHSFKNIKTLTKFEFQSQRKTISSFRTEQATQQYNTIQVQKDIKVKTLYFFKWCQYVQKAKIVKQLKNREVQNQKISLSFNKYALKFNYFVAWKKFYKKQKLQRERSKTISTRYRDNLLRKCMNAVIEISSIIGVQHQISDKITKKIVEYQKKKLLKKLKTNNQIIKNRIKYKKLNNIKVFQFIQMYQGRFKPLMNKSFQLARQKFQKQLEKTITHKYFNQLIKFNKDRKDKVKKLLVFRRNSIFLFWRKKYISQTCFQQKQTQIAAYLYKRRRNMVITILNFNKLVREQQFNKLQSMRQNPLTNRSFIQVKIKKQNQQKKKKLNQYLMQKFLQQLMEKLRNYQDSCYKRINDYNNTKLLSLKRLLNKSNQNKKKLGQKQKYYNNLSKKHQKKILFSSFKRWRKIKYYQKIEEANIIIIQKCFKKIAVKLFWNKFVFRVKQKQCVAKLVDASNLALIRLAYLKILGRTNIINDTIKTMKQSRDRKLMRNLFELLIRNQRFNSQRALQIQKYQGKRCQKLLIKRLKQQINFKNKTIRATNASYYRRKIQFLKRLKEQGVFARKLVQKAQKVSKSTFIRCFKKSVEQNIRVKQYINEKAGQIEQRLSQLMMNRFIRLLKHNKSGKQSIQLRKDKILFKISRTAILRIKLINQRIKNYKILKSQQKLLVKRRIIDSVKVFGLQNKYKKLKTVLQQTKMKSAMRDLNLLCLAASKIKRCSLLQHQRLFIRRTAEFYSCLIKQKQQSEQKMINIQQSLSKKTKGKIKKFFTLSKNNKQNNINIQNLSRLRKSKLFSQFMATSLRCKFYRIKFNCSLKFYAKNLMKKAFKSLKQVHMKIKQKQNMQRIDKNSSIMIEKSIQKSFKSNSLSQQIQRFNLRKSRQIR